jgi:GTP cyclohydrolase I
MIDQEAAERAVSDYLVAIGLDPTSAILEGTPRRVALAAFELFGGIDADPVEALGGGEPIEGVYPGPVSVRDVPFVSMCEHHLLPFNGTASVAYLPGKSLAGVGDFDALLRVLGSRPQMQERLTDEIAEVVTSALGAQGVIVVLEAEHACMWARGERTVGSTVRTIGARGEYDHGGARRAEALALVGLT